jgi:hypothetical protein
MSDEAQTPPVGETPPVDPRDAQIAFLTQQLNNLRGSRGVQVADPTPFVAHTVTAEQEHNLPAIAEQHGVDPALIYAHNAVTLEGNAQARGFRDSEGGRLIWPGTELKVPAS